MSKTKPNSKTNPFKVGIIGCGNISDTYLKNAAMFNIFEIVAVTDLDLKRAKEKAKTYGVKASSVADLLKRKDIDLVINLTIPAAHFSVAKQVLQSGKHVYNEKPLSIEIAQGKELLELAAAKNLRVGCAPDTFLGAGLQTAREFIDAGGIGQAVGAHAMFINRGPDLWHPDPEFFFQHGAGPLFDIGPYYVTALVNFFGPVKRVTASGSKTFPVRQIMSGPKAGKKFDVGTLTHVAATLQFVNGAIATLTVSFDAVTGSAPNIELYGTGGALLVNDPNMFTGKLSTRDGNGPWGMGKWKNLKVSRPYQDNARGLGVAEMLHAIRANRPHRASGELALHALEVMHAILTAAKTQKTQSLKSKLVQPAALPKGKTEKILE